VEASIRILLVRHGETDWNRLHRFQGRSDVPLNENGIGQARALSESLRREPLLAIYSSPLIRALETARMIHSFHPGIPLVSEQGFAEMDLGAFDGLDAAHWASAHPEFLRAWQEDPSSVRMPGGETLAEVQARALESMDRVLRGHAPGDHVLIAGHNFVNLTILCHALGTPLSRFREVRQGTAALNRLIRQEGRLWVEALNDRSHLRPSGSPCETEAGQGVRGVEDKG
jgi:probable phosphoglycerate mutase